MLVTRLARPRHGAVKRVGITGSEHLGETSKHELSHKGSFQRMRAHHQTVPYLEVLNVLPFDVGFSLGPKSFS